MTTTSLVNGKANNLQKKVEIVIEEIEGPL